MSIQLEQRDAVRERSPEYLPTLERLEVILNASEEVQAGYVTERFEELSQGAAVGEISHIGKSIHRGFLGPRMEVRRNLLVDPIVVDDPALYRGFISAVQKFRRADGWKERSLREITPAALQWALADYFGNVGAAPETERKNREFYLNHVAPDSQQISISEFKGKGYSVCTEKGAAAQNLLAFVGLESDLIAADGCHIPAEAQESAHYYILLHAPRGEMIFDPTNPKLLNDENGHLVHFMPAMYPVTAEQVSLLLAGKSVTVVHADGRRGADGSVVDERQERVYHGPHPT